MEECTLLQDRGFQCILPVSAGKEQDRCRNESFISRENGDLGDF